MPKVKILLYYKYVTLDAPENIVREQKALCQRLDLKGRILLSTEGINGTIAGEAGAVDQYVAETTKFAPFSDIEWKISWADEQVFPKLRVVLRDEIVTLGIKKTGEDVSIEQKASYIEPQELRSLYENGDDFVILDARNTYEATIGKFSNAIVPPIEAFRDFPKYVEENLSHLKNKKVITYCTGGVRCEKASAYLREQGFLNVQQLHGGIHEYGEQAGGKYFEGEMFVFDKRLHVPVNTENPTTLSTCIYCSAPLTRLVDCTAHGCDELFVCCESCQEKHQSACSEVCEGKISRRVDSSQDLVDSEGLQTTGHSL